MDQVIQFLATDYKMVTSYLPSSFQLREDRPHVWLQKIALWVLRKLGCFAIHNEQIVVRRTLETEDFVKAIVEQQNELMRTYHYRGKRLLVGQEEFAKLHGFPVNHPLSLTCKYFWQEPIPKSEPPFYSMSRTTCDLKVTVIPWLKGFIVLPEELE